MRRFTEVGRSAATYLAWYDGPQHTDSVNPYAVGCGVMFLLLLLAALLAALLGIQ